MFKKIFRIALLLVMVGTFIWTLWFLYAKSQKPDVVFQTQVPVKTDIIKKTVATGSVVPRREVLVKSQVSGIVDEIYVQAGHMIKKGEAIAKVRIIPNMISLNEAESRVNKAQISYDQAKVDFDRYRQLFTNKVVSTAEFQQYEVRMRSANEELKSSKDNLDLIKDGVAKSSGKATNTIIRATLSGMVLDVPVKEGFSVIEANTFNEGTTIASVADMGEMIFEGKVDESEVGKIKQGMSLILTVGAIENQKFKAELEYISPKGITENGAIQFQIRAAVKLESNQFLRAGYSANADIILAEKDKVLSLPESVLQFAGDTTYVEVEMKANEYRKQVLKTGLSDGINIEILDGITEKDKVKIPLGTAEGDKKS
ncbi:efflux RND transporter periplasmic adaptor subunit [soil metagenome]